MSEMSASVILEEASGAKLNRKKRSLRTVLQGCKREVTTDVGLINVIAIPSSIVAASWPEELCRDRKASENVFEDVGFHRGRSCVATKTTCDLSIARVNGTLQWLLQWAKEP